MLLETTFCLLWYASVCTYAVCSEAINVFIHSFIHSFNNVTVKATSSNRQWRSIGSTWPINTDWQTYSLVC